MVDEPESISVLHIDDEPDFAQMAAEFLEREDERFQVDTALNADEGLDRFADDGYDCLVSDYDMPGRNGIELLEIIRRDHPDFPFILFTGKGSEEIASEAISAGVTDYLQKERGTGQYSVLANRIINAVNRRRTERDLRASEQRYRQLLEAAPVPILLYSADLEVIHTNEAAVEFLNADDRQQLIGKHAMEFAHPDNKSQVQSRLERVASNKESIPAAEAKIIAVDGKEKHAVASSTPGMYEGEPVVQTVAYDITEQKAQAANYRSIFENTPEGIVLHDAADGSFVDMNTRYVEMYGYESKEEFLDVGFEAIHPDTPPYTLERAWEQVQKALTEGSHTFEWLAVRAGGSQFWAEVHLAPVELHGEQRILAAVRDITDRKEREEELRETSRRLNLALDATETGVWEWELETGEVIWSETLERLLDIEPGSFDGTYEAHADYLHPDDVPVVEREAENAMQGDGTFDAEFRMIREDGEQIWVKGRGQVFTENGSDRMIGTATDITERKKHEQELTRQNERLDKFASMVSHDLRGPLNIAAGRLELAIEDRDWDELDGVARAHDRMETLIDDLLALASAGETVGESDPVEMATLIEACWRSVDTKSAELNVETDSVVHADESRLQQLLENLLRNAVEHGGDDVTVTIGDLDNGFYVEDDGQGIPPHKRDDVLASGYSTQPEGTGLGLDIVQEIAEAHGWDITLTDSDDGGARFEFTGVEIP